MLDKLHNMSILSENIKWSIYLYGTVKQILYSNELIHLFKNILYSVRGLYQYLILKLFFYLINVHNIKTIHFA